MARWSAAGDRIPYPRWPRALKILTESPKVDGTAVLTVACQAAYCDQHGRIGPLRDSTEDARRDRAEHLIDVHGLTPPFG